MMRWLLALCLLVTAIPVIAQDTNAPVVRVEVKPATVTIGQPVRLRVTVLVPTWFTRPPTYPTFEMPNTLAWLPPDSSFPTSVEIGGETWSGIVRDYQIYPLIAGVYRLTDQRIRVIYADPKTRKKISATASVPPIGFRGATPKGAAGMSPFLPARMLKLNQKIAGTPENLKVGDAIVRTLTARVDGVPVMFVPPLIDSLPITNIRRYAKEPIVAESGVGKALGGTRTETVTYVFNEPGTYSLPAVTVKWWNTTKSEIMRSSVPAITVTVEGGAAPPSDQHSAVRTNLFWSLAAGLLGAIMLLLATRRYSPHVLNRIRSQRNKWRQSEKHAFRRLLASARQDHSPKISLHLSEWLARLSPGMTTSQLAAVVGSEALKHKLKLLGAASFGRDGSEKWIDETARNQFVSELKNARQKYKTLQSNSKALHLLPLLNPTQLEI